MSEVKCPNCGTVFKVDSSEYASLLLQIRDEEFEKSVDKAVKDAVESATALVEKESERALLEKDRLIDKLQSEIESGHAKQQAEIEKMKLDMETERTQKLLEIDRLKSEVDAQKKSFDSEKEAEASKLREAFVSEKYELQRELDAAKQELNQIKASHELDTERMQTTFKNEMAIKLKAKDDAIQERERAIADLRDMRQKLSIKLLGESLEQHCEVAFNQLRATAFRNAEFTKDNEAKEGTKGDYIFREKTPEGAELISIMFEMKTESETSVNRHTNESHLKKRTIFR